MKKLFLALATVIMATTAWAIPAKKGLWRTLTMTDGTEVRAQLQGDEHLHFWQTEDGLQLVETQDGVFAPANMEQLRAKALRRAAKANNSRQRRVRNNAIGDFMNYTGQKKGLIILVEFSNMTFQASNDSLRYTRICNEVNYQEGSFRGSVYDYFKAQSYGKFELTFDVVGPVKMPNTYQYYGQDSGGEGNDIRPGLMVATACQAIVDEVDFADYDWDGDGYVDQVMIIYAGQGQADGGAANTIWPHEWELDESDYGHTLQLDGVTINTYAVANERTNYSIEGIGTICHEFSHCLGLPDMYDVNYGGNYGMGEWSLMDSGSYNGDGFCPAGYSSFDKFTCGWVTPDVLTADRKIEGMKALTDAPDVYMMRNDAYEDEYYLIENRQQKGWDSYVPSNGMLVLHVDFDRDIWEYNLVNTDFSGGYYYGEYYPSNDHQRCTPIRPYVGSGWYSSSHDTYPYQGLDSLTNNSSPSASVYNTNTDGSHLMNKALLDIKQNSNGTVSFNFRNSSQPVVLPEGTLFYESFNGCAGRGGNDDLWSTSIASSVFAPDNEGWATRAAYGGYQCARFGNGSTVGLATTPAFSVDGYATISFKAAAWNKDGTELQLFIEGDEATIKPDVVNMQSFAWDEFTAVIEARGEVKVSFLPAKRFMLDEVLVIEADESVGIATVNRPAAAGSNAVFSIDGRRLGSSLSSLPHGLYIVNGKKIAK